MLPKDIELIIDSVGDIATGDFAAPGYGIASIAQRHSWDFLFQKVPNCVKDADLLIGNLEGALSSEGFEQQLRLCGAPEMASALKSAGFDIISVANNHVLDHGEGIFHETIESCLNAGLQVCGLRGDGDYFCKPVIIEKKGIMVGFLAYNWIGLEDNAWQKQYIASVDDGLVNYTWDRTPLQDKTDRDLINKNNKYVFSDIRTLKKQVDIVVLLPHWGYEWTIYPPYGVILEARAFIDSGVDLILGSHPHVAQGIEAYNDKLIVYSHGNFLFDPQPEKFFLGMLLECSIKKNGIGKYNYFALTCDDRCQPKRASDVEQSRFRQTIEQSTEAIISDSAEIELDDELIYKEYERGYNQRKVKKVKYLFFAMLKDPSMIKPVLHKILNLLELIVLRIKGRKVRW